MEDKGRLRWKEMDDICQRRFCFLFCYIQFDSLAFLGTSFCRSFIPICRRSKISNFSVCWPGAYHPPPPSWPRCIPLIKAIDRHVSPWRCKSNWRRTERERDRGPGGGGLRGGSWFGIAVHACSHRCSHTLFCNTDSHRQYRPGEVISDINLTGSSTIDKVVI